MKKTNSKKKCPKCGSINVLLIHYGYIDDPDAIEPVITVKESDGSEGYKSAIYVRSDSDIYSIKDITNDSVTLSSSKKSIVLLHQELTLPSPQ